MLWCVCGDDAEDCSELNELSSLLGSEINDETAATIADEDWSSGVCIPTNCDNTNDRSRCAVLKLTLDAAAYPFDSFSNSVAQTWLVDFQQSSSHHLESSSNAIDVASVSPDPVDAFSTSVQLQLCVTSRSGANAAMSALDAILKDPDTKAKMKWIHGETVEAPFRFEVDDAPSVLSSASDASLGAIAGVAAVFLSLWSFDLAT